MSELSRWSTENRQSDELQENQIISCQRKINTCEDGMTLLDESSFVMPALNLSFQVIASLEACAKQGHTCPLLSVLSLADEPWLDLM